MSAFRGILTGFGMAAIKDKEAKDNAKMEVVKAAGIDYYTNQLPAHKKEEANRSRAYKELTAIFGSEEAADYYDANFSRGDGKDVERALKMLEDKDIKANAFKDYVPTENYGDRYTARQTDFETRFDIVDKNLSMQQGGIGKSTIKGLLTEPEGDITTTKEVTTPAVEAQQIEGTPIMTSGTPEKTETVTSTLPRTSSDSAMSAFFIPKGVTSNLGKENDIAASVGNIRGFKKGLKINEFNGEASINFGNVKDTEYMAIKSVMNDLAEGYKQEDGKTNLSAVAEAADTQLRKQTQGFTSDLFEPNTFKETTSVEGITGSTAGNFTNDFVTTYPTPRDQKIYLLTHMSKLGTTSEKRYFALSFPIDAVYPGTTTNIRATLIKAAQ